MTIGKFRLVDSGSFAGELLQGPYNRVCCFGWLLQKTYICIWSPRFCLNSLSESVLCIFPCQILVENHRRSSLMSFLSAQYLLLLAMVVV